MTRSFFSFAAGAVVLAVPALAGSINISPLGGGITLNSGDFSSTVFGSVKPAWGAGSLASVHNALNASGIDTEGRITFVPADTDHGLALLVLIDREVLGSQPGSTGHVQMTSVGTGANLQFINNISSTVTTTTGPGGSRVANANFQWNSNGGGDAFAWANLQSGNDLSFRFLRPPSGMGLLDTSTFQFVSWTGAGWEQVSLPPSQALFASDGTFGFTGRIAVPLPSVFAMGVLPLMALSGIRRRRARA